jgi:hypothetical protein
MLQPASRWEVDMTQTLRLCAIGLALLTTTATTARAADVSPAALQAKVRAALRNAHAFVESVTIKPNLLAPLGGTMTFTAVAPNRYHQVVVGTPGGNDDTIIIGHEVYGRKGNGWTVQTWSDYLVNGFEEDSFDVKVLSVGPDQTTSGKTVGTFVSQDPRGPKPTDSLQCTYDTTTFRPLTCANSIFAIAYAYDDPTVAIERPANAVRLDK